jgi:large subunit ribosomal protein L9
MQVILIQDVPHLGSLGDEVHVKDGFARNFLLPRGMAIMAGSRKSGEIEHHRTRLEQLRQQAIEAARGESEKVGALELVVHAKAGANGKLFGSVTNRDIQAVLAEQGYTLDRRAIQLLVPIKSVGNFTATVKLHTDVKVEVGIRVEPLTETGAVPGEEGAPAEGAEAAEGAEGGERAETAEEAESGAAAETAEGAESGAAAEGGETPASEAAPEAEGETTSEGAEAAPDEAPGGSESPPAEEPEAAEEGEKEPPAGGSEN